MAEEKMSLVSVIIPARNEPYLQRTIDGILNAASGEVEITAVLDGYWPEPVLRDDDRVRLIHFSESRGMRAAINAAARVSQGEYLLKCDAHCLFCKDFDLLLAKDCIHQDWTIVPRRYRLNVENWEAITDKVYDFQYIRKNDLKGKDWPEYAERAIEGQYIFDLMTSQGSCWFMHRDRFWELGGLDDVNYGAMGREAQEVCLKSWLSGGRYALNRNVWYAHWSKDRGLYHGMKGEKQKSVQFALDCWTGNKWPMQKHDLDWLVGRFAPVPTWGNGTGGDDYAGEASINDRGCSISRGDIRNTAEGKEEDAKAEEKDGKEESEEEENGTEDSERPIAGDTSEDATVTRIPEGSIRVVKKLGMNRAGLYRHFASLGFKVGVEIGVQRGRNAAVMFENIPGLKLYLIDPYKDYEWSNRRYGAANHAKFKRMTLKRLRGRDIVLLEMFSEDGIREIPDDSLDFAYIDGMHLYDYAMQDFILCSRKVREGGIISGHDYDKNSSVVQVMYAVNDYVRAHKIDPLYLTDAKAYVAKGDKTTSWFWVNPPRHEARGRIKNSG